MRRTRKILSILGGAIQSIHFRLLIGLMKRKTHMIVCNIVRLCTKFRYTLNRKEKNETDLHQLYPKVLKKRFIAFFKNKSYIRYFYGF